MWFTLDTSHTSIIRLALYNQNEANHIFNPQFKAPKINGDSSNTKKMHLVSIYEPTIPSTWQTKKTTCQNWVVCWPHQTKGFSFFDYCTHNWWNNYSSFFKVDLIASSLDTICPQKKTLFPIVTTSIGGVVILKRAKKDVKWVLKIVKIGEIFMLYHLKPW